MQSFPKNALLVVSSQLFSATLFLFGRKVSHFVINISYNIIRKALLFFIYFHIAQSSKI